MTSVFSWQNSLSLCPTSFCTSRPNLPVTPGISWLPTFAFQYPVMKRKSLFFDASSRRSCWSSWNHSTLVSSALVVGAQTWITVMLNGLSWKWTEITLGFEIAPKYCISNSFVDYEGYSISSKGFLSRVVAIMVIWIKFAHSRSFSWLISKMLILSSPARVCLIYLDSWFLCNTVLYSIGLYFQPQTHPQLSILSALAQPLPPLWSSFSSLPQ